jgi:3-(3-hydroxy-phenyl)propionate hydroxylase
MSMRLRRTLMHENSDDYRLSAIGYRLSAIGYFELDRPGTRHQRRIASVKAQLPVPDGGYDPILIVGAGPTGLTAALELAYFGIRSIIFDDDDKLSDGSRAIVIHGSVLEIFDKLGCADVILEKGVIWQTARTYFRTIELYRQHMAPPAPGALPTFINLQQYYTESILLDHIQASGLAEVRWRHRVVNATQDDTGVMLEVVTPDGTQHFRGPYALACDGARSAMRKLMHLSFPGQAHLDYFLIADIRAELPFACERLFFFDPPSNPGRTVLIQPQPDNVWRIDMQLPADANIAAEHQPENIDRRIRAVIGDIPYELIWLSDYRFHERLLNRFRHRRIFFLGDAAHLMPPFGARGMNSGLHDVDNLIWKLWLVLEGRAPNALLDTYHIERWAAQKRNQEIVNTTMSFIVPSSKRRLAVRNTILRASAYVKVLRKLVDSGKMFEPIRYQRSPIVARDRSSLLARRWRQAPLPGAKAPDCPCVLVEVTGPRAIYLHQLFGKGFVALLFTTDLAAALVFAGEVFASPPAAPTRLFIVTADSAPSAALPQNVHLLRDPERSLAKPYAAWPGSMYLIRPDGYLAARRRTVRPAEFRALVQFACLSDGPPERVRLEMFSEQA